MLINALSFVLLLSPTTTSTQPSIESDLRRIIANLQKQVVELKREVAELQRENDSLRARLPRQIKAKVNPMYDIAIIDQIEAGMTREEVEILMRRGADSVTRDTTKAEIATWYIYQDSTPANNTPVGRITVYFDHGVVVKAVGSN